MVLPLPALTHKRLAAIIPASNTTSDVMDAIADALAASTYYDAVSRTAGSGDAWTATKEISGDTVALRLHPPTGSPATGLAGVIAGVEAGAPTPSMISSDSFVVGCLMGGCFRNVPGSPTWNGWDNASPYTSADFTGYARFRNTGSVVTNIVVIESKETIHILIRKSTVTMILSIGALWEGAASADVESNDRLFGVFTTPSATQLNTGFHTTTGSTGFFNHTASDGAGKCVQFDPGVAGDTIIAVDNAGLQSGSFPMNATWLRGPVSDAVIGAPMWCLEVTSGKFAGMIRNIFAIADQQGFPIIRDGATDKLYVCSAGHASVFDALAFQA